MSSRRKGPHLPDGIPSAKRSAPEDSYVAGVRPLPPRPARMPPSPPAAPTAAPTSRASPGGMVSVWKEDDDRLRGARTGHEGAIAQLARGELPMYGTLDLHGLAVVDAEREVTRFFAATRGPRRRAVVVVHGKGLHSPGGKSVLREAMIDWLTSTPLSDAVLGFATARARDGGAGALYVLLAPHPRL